jgi:hypothetical protein
MQANPDTFHCMCLGKTKEEKLILEIDNDIIYPENEIKLHGVTIDFECHFNTHISNICKKASQKSNALKRMGAHLTKLAKLTIYDKFIRFKFNYCPFVWHFYRERVMKKRKKINSGNRSTFYI